MAITTTMLASDLAEIFGDQFLDSFTWRGTSYSCIASDTVTANKLANEGITLEATLRLHVLVSEFAGAAQPKANDLIIHNSIRYRIAENGITYTADGLVIIMSLDREIQ